MYVLYRAPEYKVEINGNVTRNSPSAGNVFPLEAVKGVACLQS